MSELKRCAFHVARGFQSLFNQGEAAAAVQLEQPGRKRVFWDQTLDYCVAGNLQSLLDEQLHFEADGLAMFDGTDAEKLEKAATVVHTSLTLRRSSIDVRGLERRRNRKAEPTADLVRLRCRHGARFAEVKEADGAVSRLDAVRRIQFSLQAFHLGIHRSRARGFGLSSMVSCRDSLESASVTGRT